MIPIGAPQARSQGALIAFIDLLFLLVAFFALLLFFIEQRKVVAEQALERTQQKLAAVEEERGIIAAAVDSLQPMMQQFLAQQRQEAEKRRQRAARALRKKRRPTFRLLYHITPDGQVQYKGSTYDLARFKTEVVDKLREEHWIAFRARADAATPFGLVVRSRRLLLERSGEFDTYWDNLVQRR